MEKKELDFHGLTAQLEQKIRERTAQYESTGKKLRSEIGARQQSEFEFQNMEQRVKERSTQLEDAKRRLKDENTACCRLEDELKKARAALEKEIEERSGALEAVNNELQVVTSEQEEKESEFSRLEEGLRGKIELLTVELDSASNKVKDEISNRRKLQSKHEKAQANAKRQMGERNARIEAAERILMMERRTLRSADVKGCEVERVADMDRPALCLPDRVGYLASRLRNSLVAMKSLIGSGQRSRRAQNLVSDSLKQTESLIRQLSELSRI